MELLEVLITLPLRKSNTCGCYYGTVSVPTTADTIAEIMRPLLLPLELLRLLEQSMIMTMLNCGNDLLRLLKEVLQF
jgi:hypothetical protein